MDVYFLDDGIPVSLVDSGSDAFDVEDISGVDANISNPTVWGLVITNLNYPSG